MATSGSQAYQGAVAPLACLDPIKYRDVMVAENTTSIRAARPLLGAILMIAAMGIIPLVDGIAKYTSAELSPLLISWTRYFAGAAMIAPIAAFSPASFRIPVAQFPSQIARTVLLVGSMTCYFLAIATVPLADAAGAYFVAPIIATVLAAVMLGERLTIARLLAVGLGFAGTLLIVRPGASMDAGMIWALGAGFLFACYMIATRKASQASPPLATLGFQYALGALLLAPFAIATWSIPAPATLALLGAMAVLSLASHLMSITAFRHAEASALSPLVYVELIGAAAIGFVVFGDVPTLLTWIGIGVIVIAGLCLITRQR